LARIGRQALDIAALAFGIDRVEGEGGFARARQAGDDHQPVAWDIEVDIFQIVLARAADGDHAGFGAPVLGASVVETVVHGCRERNENERELPARREGLLKTGANRGSQRVSLSVSGFDRLDFGRNDGVKGTAMRRRSVSNPASADARP
jgi:hypothetical protein